MPRSDQPRNVGGRPPVHPDGSTKFSLLVANPSFDEACEIARRRGIDIAEFVRRCIDNGILADRRMQPRV